MIIRKQTRAYNTISATSIDGKNENKCYTVSTYARVFLSVIIGAWKKQLYDRAKN